MHATVIIFEFSVVKPSLSLLVKRVLRTTAYVRTVAANSDGVTCAVCSEGPSDFSLPGGDYNRIKIASSVS